MKRFVIGDIHGRFTALKDVLKKAKFNYANDKLILLGDIADGGSHTYQVIEELLKIKNLVYCIGNHDVWFMNHISSGWAEEIWLQQGGANTLRSYGAEVTEAKRVNELDISYTKESTKLNTRDMNIPVTHQEFFNKGVHYHIEDEMLFVHGGINPAIPKITSQCKQDLLWDRDLINYCRKGKKVPGYKMVFVGHTTTQGYNSDTPLRFKNLQMMDTGAGWDGLLSLMNIDTRQVWQSKKQTPDITPNMTELSYKEFLDELN